jgi:dipeptidyl aminopeptidase/acylaminoacyl peptidase
MRFLQNSPLARADHIQTPILLIDSDLEDDPGEYEAMFTALNRLHRRAKLITYWGEGHGASSPANIRHAWESIFAWFDATLKAGSEAR